MYYSCDQANYIQYLYQCLELQQKKIEQLEIAIELLQADYESLKQSSGRPEKIEYKFDQLKVERLEGTLNIGITPSGGMEPTSIEDFSINRNKVHVISDESTLSSLQAVKNEVNHYLNGECFNVMKMMENQYNYQLDPPYRNFIIEDIKNQIDNRIQFYLNNANLANRNETEKKEIEARTINKVKEDIHRTIEEFIKHLPMRGE